MQTIEPTKTHTKRRVLLWLLAGVVLLAAVFVATVQTDLSHTRQSLSSAADYVWSQCARYDRIELATQAKSLMRVIQSCKQSASDLGTESDPPSSALQSCVETNYLSGILLLDTSGRVLSQYHESSQMPDGIGEALASPALLDTAVHPESYDAALRLLELCGYTLKDVAAGNLKELPARLKAAGDEKAAEFCGVGALTLHDAASARTAAEKIGYPVMLKACMGGVLLAGIIMGLASAGLLGALSTLFSVG